MPKVNYVASARKDYPENGIKKGESYYWWKFRYGGKRVSKTRPRPSQLTQSAFKSQYYAFQEQLQDLRADNLEDLESELSTLAGEIRDLGDEQSSNRDNMPDALQDSETGELLQTRADGMNEWADAIESVDYSLDYDGPQYKCGQCEWTGEEDVAACPACSGEVEETDEYKEAVEERIQAIIEEVNGADPGLD